MHPATEPRLLHPMLEHLLEIQGTIKIDAVDKVKDIVGWVDYLTDGLPKDKAEEYKEKFARLEIQARNEGKRLIRDFKPKSVDKEFLIDRYGEEHRDFITQFGKERFPSGKRDSDKAEKMAGTVTTTSAPAMFNKVVRGRKKKKEKDE